MEKSILHWNGQSSASCGYLQLYLRRCFWKHLKVQPDLSQSCNNNCFFQKSSCSVLWHIWFLTPRFLFFLIKAVKDVFCKVFLTHASTKLYFSAKSMFFYEISRKKRKSYNPQDHLCKCISRLHEDDLCVSQYDTGFAPMVQMTDSLFFLQLGWINDKILLYIHDIFRNTPFAALIRMYHPFRKVWGYYLLSQRAFFLQARTQYLFLEICSKKEYETDSVSFVLFIMERFILFYQSSFSADTNKRYPKEIQSLLLILYSPF